jgi:hypothetical protein
MEFVCKIQVTIASPPWADRNVLTVIASPPDRMGREARRSNPMMGRNNAEEIASPPLADRNDILRHSQ